MFRVGKPETHCIFVFALDSSLVHKDTFSTVPLKRDNR